MRVVDYRFDLMAECPQCYNITEQMRMILKDENGKDKDEWDQCLYCGAVCKIGKSKEMGIDDI